MKSEKNTVVCPWCAEKVEPPPYEEMKYHKHGRVWRCPECKKNILFQRPAKNYKANENGTLERKYKPKK